MREDTPIPIAEEEWASFELEQVGDDWWLDAKPMCWRCTAEVDALQHYCHRCNAAVGQFTPWISFVNIPMACEPFGIMWERAWWPGTESPLRRATYWILLLAAGVATGYVWILLLAFILWTRSPPPRPGYCRECGFDLRSGHERCPECGRPPRPEDSHPRKRLPAEN